MTPCIPNGFVTYVPAARGKMNSSLGGLSVGVFRLPTDPLYYMELTLENIVVGSRYRITRQSTGDELATGVAASTTEVISGVPVYESNMLMAVTVRKASGSPNYKIFDTNVYAAKLGASVYILQQLDE